MLPLGHMGIGRWLVTPWSENLPIWPIYLGAVLPDLIDKPMYYLQVLATGRHGHELGLICGTRTIGHTTLLAMFAGLLAWGSGSAILRALALGMASHLVLDTVGDFVNLVLPTGPVREGPSGGIEAVLFPLLGWHFPGAKTPSFKTYAVASFSVANVLGELIGAYLLYREWQLWRQRTASP